MSDELAAQSYKVCPITMISYSKQLIVERWTCVLKNHLNLSNKRLSAYLEQKTAG